MFHVVFENNKYYAFVWCGVLFMSIKPGFSDHVHIFFIRAEFYQFNLSVAERCVKILQMIVNMPIYPCSLSIFVLHFEDAMHTNLKLVHVTLCFIFIILKISVPSNVFVSKSFYLLLIWLQQFSSSKNLVTV